MENIAKIGHNLSPFEISKQAIEDLYEEAKQWLDGEPVSTEDQASALNTLQTRIREATKDAEKNRKEEAKPFDEGKAEVQARYKPILAKADEADSAVKAALKPYLLALAKKQEEDARKAREEAILEILRTTNTQLRIAQQSKRPVSADVIKFSES